MSFNALLTYYHHFLLLKKAKDIIARFDETNRAKDHLLESKHVNIWQQPQNIVLGHSSLVEAKDIGKVPTKLPNSILAYLTIVRSKLVNL